MISQIDPITRLDLLREYMGKLIDKWPTRIIDFDQWLHNSHSHLIPGTIRYARANATHCFYCGRCFKGKQEILATIDHWVPQSKGKTERFVICCSHCNNHKGDSTPTAFIKRITNAEMKGLPLFGYHGKTLKTLFEAAHTIANNIHYNTGPKIFYIKK